MTPHETGYPDTVFLRRENAASFFLPLLVCYAGSAALAWLAARNTVHPVCYVSCPLSGISVYGTLAQLTSYLSGTVRQLLLVFVSAFTLFPAWISVGTALYRGLCTGLCLALAESGSITGAGSPQLALPLYFLASVLLLLFASFSHSSASVFAERKKYGFTRSLNSLILSWIRCFLVMAGGILALSVFAIITS